MLLRSRGEPVKLERRPLDLLVLLVSRHGSMVGREEIIAALWPAKVIIDFESGINTLVRKVRNALDDSPDESKFIETVPGRGYRFVAAVTDVAQPRVVPHTTVAPDTAVPTPPDLKPDTTQRAKQGWRSFAVGASLALIGAIGAFVVLRSETVSSADTSGSAADVETQVLETSESITLAVLPFKPLTESDRNESLELGMTETLISGLNASVDCK